jgi:hypothetical protein
MKWEASMLIKNEQALLPLGMFCLVGGILLNRFAAEIPVVSFLEGMLLGASLVFNIAYLIRIRSKKRDS